MRVRLVSAFVLVLVVGRLGYVDALASEPVTHLARLGAGELDFEGPRLATSPSGRYATLSQLNSADASYGRVRLGSLPHVPKVARSLQLSSSSGQVSAAIGVDAAGDAVVASDGESPRFFRFNTVLASGRVLREQLVSGYYISDLSVDPRGTIYLLAFNSHSLWLFGGRVGGRIRRLGRVTSCAEESRLASDRRGSVQILWRCTGSVTAHGTVRHTPVVLRARRWSAGRFSPSQRLAIGTSLEGGDPCDMESCFAYDITGFDASSDAQGNIVAAWDRGGKIFLARRPRGRSEFEAAQVAVDGEGPYLYYGPRPRDPRPSNQLRDLAVDADGSAWVLTSATGLDASALIARRIAADGELGTSNVLAGDAYNYENASIASNERGRALVSWIGSATGAGVAPSGPRYAIVDQTSIRWRGADTRLRIPDDEGSVMTSGSDGRGHALVLFLARAAGAREGSLFLRTFDNLGP
jgi:hypothetical protein